MEKATKKWNQYLFEFLMLFLAVTLGFFVDNLREGKAERHLELQHVASLISDLRQDTLRFNRQINEANLVIGMCDSIVLLINKNDRQAKDQQKNVPAYTCDVAKNTSAFCERPDVRRNAKFGITASDQ